MQHVTWTISGEVNECSWKVSSNYICSQFNLFDADVLTLNVCAQEAYADSFGAAESVRTLSQLRGYAQVCQAVKTSCLWAALFMTQEMKWVQVTLLMVNVNVRFRWAVLTVPSSLISAFLSWREIMSSPTFFSWCQVSNLIINAKKSQMWQNVWQLPFSSSVNFEPWQNDKVRISPHK